MNSRIYLFHFSKKIEFDGVQAALLESLLAASSLPGGSRVYKETIYSIDQDLRTCMIRTNCEAGQNVVRIFSSFLLLHFDEEVFSVERFVSDPSDFEKPNKPKS